MNPASYQTAPITCPSCNNRFATPVLTIIDVGQNPDLKALFLSGQVNIAVCPQCGNAGMLSTPLVYHDPDKELLFTFAPTEMGIPQADQERLLGDLTNQVISTLPAEERKGYLLRPRSFLRLEGMVEAILEADGVTPEMLEAQRVKMDLMNRLLQATNEEARRIIAQENNDQLDYDFFQLLTLNIEVAESQDQSDAAAQLRALRGQLLEWTAFGQDLAARDEAIRSLGEKISREDLLDKLVDVALDADPDDNAQVKIETMVTVARQAIDYIFYQQLTGHIESAEQAGDSEKAAALKALRETVLDLTAEIDAEIQQANEEAAQHLQEVLDSDDMEETLRSNLSWIDEFFFSVLAASMEGARQSGRTEDAEKLGEISNILMKIIQENQPPQIRLINQLLAADYPDGTLALLEENREQVDAALLKAMEQMADDLAKDGREELGRRLAQIQEQAAPLTGDNP